MQEWLVVGRAGVAINSMQEWLVVIYIRHAGVAINSMQEWHAGVARRWPCRSGSSLAVQEWLLIACRSGSSLAMQEWLVVGRAGVAINSMQEWLVVGRAGVARGYNSMREWHAGVACKYHQHLAIVI